MWTNVCLVNVEVVTAPTQSEDTNVAADQDRVGNKAAAQVRFYTYNRLSRQRKPIFEHSILWSFGKITVLRPKYETCCFIEDGVKTSLECDDRVLNRIGNIWFDDIIRTLRPLCRRSNATVQAALCRVDYLLYSIGVWQSCIQSFHPSSFSMVIPSLLVVLNQVHSPMPICFTNSNKILNSLHHRVFVYPFNSQRQSLVILILCNPTPISLDQPSLILSRFVLVDVNECLQNNPCQYSCQNKDGGFECGCPTGLRPNQGWVLWLNLHDRPNCYVSCQLQQQSGAFVVANKSCSILLQ